MGIQHKPQICIPVSSVSVSALPKKGSGARGLRRPPPPVGTTVNGYTYMGGNPRSTHPSVWKPESGDRFLNSLPMNATARALVKAIANHELLAGPGRSGTGNPEVQCLLALAQRYDPSFGARNDRAQPMQQRHAAPPANIPAGAIQLLRAGPHLAPHFDAKYGAGASRLVLGH